MDESVKGAFLLNYTEEQVTAVSNMVTTVLFSTIHESTKEKATAMTLAVLKHFNPLSPENPVPYYDTPHPIEGE